MSMGTAHIYIKRHTQISVECLHYMLLKVWYTSQYCCLELAIIIFDQRHDVYTHITNNKHPHANIRGYLYRPLSMLLLYIHTDMSVSEIDLLKHRKRTFQVFCLTIQRQNLVQLVYSLWIKKSKCMNLEKC